MSYLCGNLVQSCVRHHNITSDSIASVYVLGEIIVILAVRPRWWVRELWRLYYVLYSAHCTATTTSSLTVQRGLSLSMVCTAGHSTYLLFISTFSCRTTHCELQVNVHFLKTSSLQVIEIREWEKNCSQFEISRSFYADFKNDNVN